ncbi:hypothetical protein ABPG75_007744 [Micractinium tetrahymenae]
MEAVVPAQPREEVSKGQNQLLAAAATTRRPLQPMAMAAARLLEVQLLEQPLPVEHQGMFAAPGAEHVEPAAQPQARQPEDAPDSNGGSGGSDVPDPAEDEEAARRELAELERHVAQHGTAGEFFGAGCRWRDAPLTPALATDKRCMLQNRRGAMFGGIESVWSCHSYEYWHPEQQSWSTEQPAACRVQGMPLADWAAEREALVIGSDAGGQSTAVPASTWKLQEEAMQRQMQAEQVEGRPAGQGQAGESHGVAADALATVSASQLAPAHPWRRQDVASDSACAAHYCVLRNVWYNNGRFYYLADGQTPPLPGASWQLGRSRVNSVLHVASSADFAAGVDAKVVPGETTVLDYHFFLHPRALGHWQEMLLPLFRQGALLAVVLGVPPGRDLPPLLFQEEVAEPLDQAHQLLEGVQPGEWLLFEQVLWPRDVFTGGNRGCTDRQDAQLLRALTYAQYGLPTPQADLSSADAAGTSSASSVGHTHAENAEPVRQQPAGTPLPALPAQQPLRITLQRKSANRRLVNEAEVVEALRQFGEVRVVEFGSGATFREQLETMASTDLLVSAHTSNLANALFLRPGAAVLEVLMRNWAWEGIDRFFQSLTAQLGDVHHYAVRSQGANETLFLNPALERLFAHLPPEECYTQARAECVEALTMVDLHVNVTALRALLAEAVPHIRAGASVAEAALPWPHLPWGPLRPAPAAEAGYEMQGAPAGGSPPVRQLAKRLLDVDPSPDRLPDVDIWCRALGRC